MLEASFSSRSKHPLKPVDLESTIRSNICSMNYDASYPLAREETRLNGMRIGAIDIVRYEGHGTQMGRRTPEHIRADWADNFVLCLPLSAHFQVSQSGREAEFYPDSFVFLGTTKPFNAFVSSLAKDSAFSAIHVRIPGPTLRRRIPRIDDLCSHIFSAGPGAGHIMKSLFEVCLGNGPYLSEPHASDFSRTVLDVITSVVVHGSDTESIDDVHSNQAWRRRTVEMAQAFIERNLSNPDLDTELVAQHCNVSVRYLHAAFSCASLTVASYIRELRLQRCRDALREPSLRQKSIMEIAQDWGFRDQSHFSRCFRTRFGVAPSHMRSTPG